MDKAAHKNEAVDASLSHLVSGYAPTFSEITSGAKLPKNWMDEDKVTIPTKLFKLLLDHVIAREDFDPAIYGKENPDVAGAVATGKVESLHVHYVLTGWYEGRAGGGWVDEKWYIENNPDVREAFAQKRVRSAESHYRQHGRSEGRASNAKYLDAVGFWRAAFNAQGGTDR